LHPHFFKIVKVKKPNLVCARERLQANTARRKNQET